MEFFAFICNFLESAQPDTQFLRTSDRDMAMLAQSFWFGLEQTRTETKARKIEPLRRNDE